MATDTTSENTPVTSGDESRPVEALTTGRTRVRRSFGSQVWYMLRRWPIIPVVTIAVISFAAVFAPWVAPTDPINQRTGFTQQPPTWGRANPANDLVPDPAEFDLSTPRGQIEFKLANKDGFSRREYILGGDVFGRDLLSRLIHGARVSLMVSGLALISGVIIGTGMGVMAGYYGGWIDELLTRIVDVWNALPFLLIALIVALTLGATLPTIIILIAMIAWPPFVRQIRADVLQIRSADYVSAARVAGASNLRMMLRHVVPGTFSTVMVIATLRVGGLVLTESTLSFLGVGIPDPIPTWGKEVELGYQYLINGVWWTSVFPGLAIFLLVMSMNFFGDWLRDRLDPRLRQLD